MNCKTLSHLLPATLSISMAIPALADPGDLVWLAPIVGEGKACPAVASDGTIVMATNTDGGILYAIDPADGSILRQTQLPGTVEQSVALGDDDTIYFNTLSKDLASGDSGHAIAGAWDFTDFTQIWRSPLDRSADTSPIIGNDRIYLGIAVNPMTNPDSWDCNEDDLCGHFYSFDIETGDRIIDMATEGWAAVPGVIDSENRVFFGVEDLTAGEPIEPGMWPGRFYGIDGNDPDSGTEPDLLWDPHDMVGDFGSPVGYAEGVVYSTCRDGNLYGFDAVNGDIVFEHDLDAPSWTGTTIGRNPDNGRLVLYSGTQFNQNETDGSGKMVAIELDGTLEGDLIWSVDVPGGLGFGNPAIDDLGNVYAVTATSVLVAYDRDGNHLWSYPLPGWDDPTVSLGGIGGPTILDDGTIVVSSNGGYVVAIEGNGNHLADDVPWPKYKHDLRATSNVQTSIRHTITGDITGDGVVSTDDLLAMLAAWATDDADSDLNGDGTVNIDDLIILLSVWGD